VLEGQALTRLVTYAFVHDSWTHLLGNLWALFVFGCAVESRIGRVGFVFLYLVCAACAAITHAAIPPERTSFVIGASGAISGILGCHVVLEPGSRFISFVFLGICGFIAEIPGLFYLVVWLFFQWEGIQGQLVRSSDSCGIAWWAHLGGLACGMASGLMLRVGAGLLHRTLKPRGTFQWN
jgi:membrane associated rhomboid family serine protease